MPNSNHGLGKRARIACLLCCSLLDSLPDIDLVAHLPALLPGMLGMLSDGNAEIRCACTKLLAVRSRPRLPAAPPVPRSWMRGARLFESVSARARLMNNGGEGGRGGPAAGVKRLRPSLRLSQAPPAAPQEQHLPLR